MRANKAMSTVWIVFGREETWNNCKESKES
jgi:hypothetical protein